MPREESFPFLLKKKKRKKKKHRGSLIGRNEGNWKFTRYGKNTAVRCPSNRQIVSLSAALTRLNRFPLVPCAHFNYTCLRFNWTTSIIDADCTPITCRFPFPLHPSPFVQVELLRISSVFRNFFFSYSFIYFFFLLFSLFLIGRYLSSFDIKLVESNHRLERNQHGRDTPDFFFFFPSFFFFTFHRSIRRLIVVFLRRLDTRKHI